MRIWLGGQGAPAGDANPFRRRMASQAFRSDFVGALWFLPLVFEVADDAPAAHVEKDDPGIA
jgi:hypothetical protein